MTPVLSLKMILPWAPSLNTYWRSLRKGPLAGRVLISERGRQYRTLVALIARKANACVQGKVAVHITAYPPDKRHRDLDNLFKGVLDSLQDARIFENDSLIDDLHIVRREIRTGGELHVTVSEHRGNG